VSRNIDEAKANIPDLKLRNADVERYPASLFLGKAVSIGSGERPDKSSLSVIDVSGGADN